MTQRVPFEMVDAVAEKRLRGLPARIVVYLLLAAALFPEIGYGKAWKRLTSALEGLEPASPTAAALAQARRRLGPPQPLTTRLCP